MEKQRLYRAPLARGDTLQLGDAFQLKYADLRDAKLRIRVRGGPTVSIDSDYIYSRKICNGEITHFSNDSKLVECFTNAHLSKLLSARGYDLRLKKGERIAVYKPKTMACVMIDVTTFNKSAAFLEINMPRGIPVIFPRPQY